jgi:Tfp pilus assembly protein PilF
VNENKAREYNNMGNLFMQKKDYNQALDFYLKAISLYDEESVFYHNAGVCLLILEEKQRAITLLKRAFEKGTKIDETELYLVSALYEIENYSDVLSFKEKRNNKYYIDINMLKLKSAIKLSKIQQAKKIINTLKMAGFNSQELELIENMLWR